MWLVLLSTVNAQAWQDGPSPAVLMMGNSYTFQAGGLDNRLRPMLEEGLAVDQVRVRALAEPGRTLADHYGWAMDPEHPWAETLDEGGWDYLIAQDQSQIPGFPETESYWQASAAGAEGLGGLVEEQGGELVLLMTWGRRDGDATNAVMYPDYPTMQARLEQGYLAYAEGAEGSIAPAGFGWQVIHDDVVDAGGTPTEETAFTELYSGDGSHPSLIGSTLAAAVIYASLTGQSPIGLERGFEDLDTEQRERVQDAAHRAVFELALGRVPMPFVWGPERVAAEGGVVRHEVQHVTGFVDGYAGPLEIGPKATLIVDGLYQGQAPSGEGRLVVDGEWEITALPAELRGSLEGVGTLSLLEQPTPGEVIVSAVDCEDLSTLRVVGPSGPLEVRVDGCEIRAGEGQTGPDDTGGDPDPQGCGCSGGPAASGLIWLGMLALGCRRRRGKERGAALGPK